jgi:hypothetical protein
LQAFGVKNAEILQFFWVGTAESRVEELFRSKLKNVIHLRHDLVRLGELINIRQPLDMPQQSLLC